LLNEKIERTRPPLAASEREMLNAWLDYHRATLLQKISEVSEEDARRRTVAPSALSLLSLVKHLAYVERWWFAVVFDGQEDKGFPEDDFQLEPEDTIQGIVDLYRAEVEKSRQIVAKADFDELSRLAERPGVSLRWIVSHMIEETARHNGHADLLREAIDGATGE
jgi:uncharacterized damage-inducible protein DinB